ncbi:hypothetical protein EJB05_01781, partial [Eragrostis curvula]
MATSSSVGALAFVLLVSILLAVVPSPTLSISLNPTQVAGGPILSPDFYKDTCPQLEDIVRRAVQAAFSGDTSIAAGLLRIHYHDCITQGCDASLLLKGKNSEQLVNVNENLHVGAMQLIERIHAEAQRQCGPTVSCADITALAAREGVVATGGPAYAVNLGQLDSLAPATYKEVRDLPGSWHSNYSKLIGEFSHMKFNDAELVALSGAHTLGSATCLAFYDRFRQWDNAFTEKIGKECERDSRWKHGLDSTPKRFDNQYYVGLLNGHGVLTSDRALVHDNRSLPFVQIFARDQQKFFDAFGKAMRHLSSLRKHPDGEVRNISCFVPNSSRRHRDLTRTDGDPEGHAASA